MRAAKVVRSTSQEFFRTSAQAKALEIVELVLQSKEETAFGFLEHTCPDGAVLRIEVRVLSRNPA